MASIDPNALGREWTCSKCGEENPHTFDACWNCQQSRSEATENEQVRRGGIQIVVGKESEDHDPGSRSGKADPFANRRSVSGRRVLAFLVDFVILNVLGALSTTLAAESHVGRPGVNSDPSEFFGKLFLILFFVFLFLRDAWDGASPGKLLCGIRVCDAITGKPTGFLQSILRNSVFLIPFFPIVEFFVLAANKDERRIGDRFGGTVVLRAEHGS